MLRRGAGAVKPTARRHLALRVAMLSCVHSLAMLGISPFWQGTFVGTFIVVAVAFDSVREGRRSSTA